MNYFEFCAENFRRNLFDLCYIKNIKLKDVAKDINVSYRTIYNYTRKKYSLPNVVIALKISEFFNVSVDDLFMKKIKNGNEIKFVPITNVR